MGGAASLHERHREARGLPAFDTLLHDLRFASRLLVKDRWFTAAVVVALALGVGVNTTVFTVINGWNLRDLPVDEPGRVMHLGTRDAHGRPRGVSYLDFLDWRDGLRAFTGLAAYADTSMNLGVEGRPADHLAGCFVSANAFSALRERPIVGRDFRPEDDRPGAAPVIIIGHDVWTERFGADPSTIGRTIRVNGAPATIVGVMPPGFMFPYLAEIWQPIAQMPDLAAQPRDARAIGVFGRLADGVTLAEARAELSAFGTALAAQFPATNQGVQGTVTRFTEQYFGSITDGPPLILMVAVGFVLLIACANAANLLLARAASRAPEISLRRALGASRGRIVRQLFVESLLLAAARRRVRVSPRLAPHACDRRGNRGFRPAVLGAHHVRWPRVRVRRGDLRCDSAGLRPGARVETVACGDCREAPGCRAHHERGPAVTTMDEWPAGR